MWSEASISHAPFDEAALRLRLQQACGDAGAIATFTGLVSADGESGCVQALELEHYPGMAERCLQDILGEAGRRWPLRAALVCHRTGRLAVGEPIVFVAVASRHRDAAFDACRFIMDYLKTDAPFWKKEYRSAGSDWVTARERDARARRRWEVPPAGDAE